MPYKKIHYFFYLFLYFTLIVGFVFNENSSGGAIYDFNIIIKAIKSFSVNLTDTYKNYSSFTISHYPYYYIFLAILFKISGSIIFVKFFTLHVSLLLPFVFYKILKLRYPNQIKYLVLVPGILFLSPYFRSSAIWALNDNFALIFFSLSILYYLKAIHLKKEHKKFKYIILNLIFIVCATYIRQYYAVFGIFFFYKFFLKFNLKLIFYYVFFGFFLTSPIFFQLFDPNLNYAFNFFSKNLFNNFVLLSTIFVIYLIPFYLNFNRIKLFILFYKKKFLLIFSILILGCLQIYFFDYHISYVDGKKMGGGIVYKIFFKENFPFLFYISFFFSLMLIVHFCQSNIVNNLIVLTFLFFMFPLGYVFQKYLDPLSMIIIFSLFQSEILNEFIKRIKNNIYLLFSYFALLYLSSLFHYYLM